MKHTITNLKAPWGAGAKLGAVFEAKAVPAWALGKCAPAADDAEVTHELGAVEVPVDIDALKASVADLSAKLADTEAALAKANEAFAEQGKKLADTEAALAAATKGKGK